MQTTLHADTFQVGITLKDDDVLGTDQSGWIWTHKEFNNLFSLTVSGSPFPVNMTGLSIEPHRDLYVYQENIDDNTVVNHPNDHPVMAAIWAKRLEIIGEARISILNDASYQNDIMEITVYTYDKQTDTINTSIHPDSEKIFAARDIGICKTKILRVLIDLIDVLLAQNVINTSQIQQDTKDRVAYVRSIIDTAEV